MTADEVLVSLGMKTHYEKLCDLVRQGPYYCIEDGHLHYLSGHYTFREMDPDCARKINQMQYRPGDVYSDWGEVSSEQYLADLDVVFEITTFDVFNEMAMASIMLSLHPRGRKFTDDELKNFFTMTKLEDNFS